MHLSTRKATILLACIISARATSFMFSKLCLTSMNTFSLLALRFSTASVLLFLIFRKRILKALTFRAILSGILIGSVFYFVLASEHAGLKTTNASTAAFIENLAIIIVPFLECLITRTFPSKRTLTGAFLAVLGVGVLTMSKAGIGFTPGEAFLLAAACFYAIAIILTARLSKTGDPLVIGFFQVAATAVAAWLNVAIHGSLTMPDEPSQYMMILILAIVCTSFGFTLQPVVQSRLPAETAASFCALGPLVASVLSGIFLKEPFTLSSLLGACLILGSLVIVSR